MGVNVSAEALSAGPQGDKDDFKTPSFVEFLNQSIDHDPVVNALTPLRSIDWLTKRYVRSLVDTQSKQHEGEETLFYHVTRGNYGRVRVIVDQLKESKYDAAKGGVAPAPCPSRCACSVCKEINGRDAVGGSAVHVAYLYREWKIGRYLVENFPAIASEPYTLGQWKDESAPDGVGDGPYTGENILHIAIIHRNYDEVRWLLEFYFKRGDRENLRKLLTQVTTGLFFHEDSSFNFGGVPLLFAVCSNRIEIFDVIFYYLCKFEEPEEPKSRDAGNECLVKVGPRAVFCWDRNGNNALHFAVLYKLDDMYMHVLKTAKNVVRKELKDAFRQQMGAGKTAEFEVHLEPLRDFWGEKSTRYNQDSGKDAEKQQSKVGRKAPRQSGAFELNRLGQENRPWKKGNFNRWLDKETKIVVRQRMGTALNRDLHSPLTLVASRPLPDREGDERDEAEAEKVRFLGFLFRELKDGRWSYGPIESSVLDLVGVLYPHERPEEHTIRKKLGRGAGSCADCYSTRIRMRSAINWLARTNTATAFLVPEVRMIVNTLWEAWAYSLFFWDFLLHVVLTLLLTLLTCLVNEQRAFFPGVPSDWALTIVLPATGALLLHICVSDCWDLYTFIRARRSVSAFALERQGFEWVNKVQWCTSVSKLHFRLVYNISGLFLNVYNAPTVVAHYLLAGVHGAVRFNKLCRVIIVIGFALFVFFRFAPVLGPKYGPPQSKYVLDAPRPGNMYYDEIIGTSVDFTPVNDISVKLPLVVIVILAWCNFYYFLMGFDYSGPFILTIVRVCYRDVPYFLAFYLIIVVAFASAIALLVNYGDPDINYGFERLLYTFWSLLKDTVALQYFGIQELDVSLGIDLTYVPLELTWLFQVLAFLFQAIVTLMMLNMLIAMLNHTFNAYHENKDQFLIMEKYNIIKYYESKIENTKAFERMREKFAHWSGHKKAQRYEIINDNKEWWKNDQKPTRRRKIALLIVCPQNDFMDEPSKKDGSEGHNGHEEGSLPVPGARADARRIAHMLNPTTKGGKERRYGHHIHEVCVAMDAHLDGHISLASSWQRRHEDGPPEDLTYRIITPDDLDELAPKPRVGYDSDWAKHYVEALEMADKYQLQLWPDHCLVERDPKNEGQYVGVKDENGVIGYDVVKEVKDALDEWAAKKKKRGAPARVNYVNIGLSRKTESYSAIQAEVSLNRAERKDEALGRQQEEKEDGYEPGILETMHRWKYDGYDVLVCGEALSHCVFNTVRDMCDLIEIDPSKIHVLRDGSSCINQNKKLVLQELREMGVQVTSIKSFFRRVRGLGHGAVEEADDDEGRFESSDEEDNDEDDEMEGFFSPAKWPDTKLPAHKQKELDEAKAEAKRLKEELRNEKQRSGGNLPAAEGAHTSTTSLDGREKKEKKEKAGKAPSQPPLPAAAAASASAAAPAMAPIAHAEPLAQTAPQSFAVKPQHEPKVDLSLSLPAAAAPGPAGAAHLARVHRRKKVPATYQLAPLSGPLYGAPLWTPGAAAAVGGSEIFWYQQELPQHEQETKEGYTFEPTAGQPTIHVAQQPAGGGPDPRRVFPSI